MRSVADLARHDRALSTACSAHSTTAVVVAFQRANNLVPDGLVGTQTLTRLRA